MIYQLSENSFYDRARRFVYPVIHGSLVDAVYYDLKYVYGGAVSGGSGCLWRIRIETDNAFSHFESVEVPSSLITSDDSFRVLLEEAIENSAWE